MINALVLAQEKNPNNIPLVSGEIAQEEILNAPVVSGMIIDRINLPSPDKPVIYLIIQDKDEKAWSCKVGDIKLFEGTEGYKKGEYVDIYGVVINQEARQVEVKKIVVKKIKDQSLSSEE